MIGHESIVSSDAVRCQCGHVLMLAEELPREIIWSATDPSPAAQIIQARWDQHIAELADRKLYGFDGDEYLENDPEAVYENWADDHDYRPGEMLGHDWGRPEKLEIIEWSSNSGDEFMPSADRIAEWAGEHYCDEASFEEAGVQMDKAASAPDVIAAFEAARTLMLSKVTFAFADRELRKLIVTWDADGQPLLDGEPMYRKVDQ